MAKGVEDKNRVRQEDFLSLADGGFSVVAGHIVVLDTVVVKVVENGQTPLVALPVVGLGSVGTTGVGPLVGGGGSARGPSKHYSRG